MNSGIELKAFRRGFYAWLNRIDRGNKPNSSIVAYNIGLFETENGFSAYLVGAEEYDENNSDWACTEAFAPKDKYFPINKGVFANWEEVQQIVAQSLRDYLKSSEGVKTFLSQAQVITVGFDDGDLDRIK
jgi:hypothetical protein